MSARTVLSVDGIDVFYDKSQILFGVGLQVKEGQTVALLGRNGAGKSTTLKAIAGLAPPGKGAIRVLGRDMTGRPPYQIARMGVGYVPEDRQVFPEHTVEDNLLIAQKKGPDGQEDWTVERVYEVFPPLEPLRRRMAGRLSGGEQQMLAIARTLMGNPIALLLDEPSEGLAPIVGARIAEMLRHLRRSGATILLAEQNMHFCLGIASDAVVIDKGEIVYADTIEGLKANDKVRQRYLAM
jgi:branched-chain amino acid transport system ATP-binding protein